MSRRYDSITQPLSPGVSVTSYRPARAATVESDVIVPVLQAVGVAVGVAMLVGFVTLLVALWLEAEALWAWVGRLTGGAWVVTFCFALIDFIRDQRMQLWDEEQRDVDRMPPGSPTSQGVSIHREPLEVIVKDENGNRQMCQLAAPERNPMGLAHYASALTREDRTTRATFSYPGGKHVNGAKDYGYSPTEFEELQAEAVRAKLFERELENQPYELTERGWLVLRRVAQREMQEVLVGEGRGEGQGG